MQQQRYPLIDVIEYGDTEEVSLLLNGKADVNALGDEAVRNAALFGHTEIVRLLLLHEADVHACCANGVPDAALRQAVTGWHTTTVRVLLHGKANVHVRSFDDGKPEFPLRYSSSIANTDCELVELLLLHRANPSDLHDSFVNTYLSARNLENVARVIRIGPATLKKCPSFSLDLFYQDCAAIVDTICSSVGKDMCTDLCRALLSYV